MITEFNIDLTFKDYLAILFRWDKRCLNCNSSVSKKIDKVNLGKGWDVDIEGHSIDIGEKHKYKVSLKYVCDTCSKSFLPRDFW